MKQSACTDRRHHPHRPAAAATLRFPNEVTQTGYGVGLSSAAAAAVANVVGP